MLLYLDNSVLNRPFDDQRQPRIWLETLAFSLVLTLIEAREARLIRSPMHDLENSHNPFALRHSGWRNAFVSRLSAFPWTAASKPAPWPWSRTD